MITRRILVTKVVNVYGGERTIYGRYDAVALANKGEKVVSSEFKNYKVSEDLFIEAAAATAMILTNSKRKEKENGNCKQV